MSSNSTQDVQLQVGSVSQTVEVNWTRRSRDEPRILLDFHDGEPRRWAEM